MTNDMMTVRALLEKSSDADLLREMIGFTAQRTDGAGDRGADRRCAWREQCGADYPAQRLPRPAVGDAGRHGGTAHPQAAQGQLFPGLPGAAASSRKGLGGGGAGG